MKAKFLNKRDRRHRWQKMTRGRFYGVDRCLVCGALFKFVWNHLAAFTAGITRRAFMPIITKQIYRESPLLSALLTKPHLGIQGTGGIVVPVHRKP